MSYALSWFTPFMLWGLAAGVPAVVLEWLYRSQGAQGAYWYELWWAIIPCQALISYSIWRLVTTPGQSLIDAFVVFALATTSLRVFLTVAVFHDKVGNGTWFALALLILARVAQTSWGR